GPRRDRSTTMEPSEPRSIDEDGRGDATRRSSGSRVVPLAIEIAIYAVTVVLLVWPIPLHFASRMVGASDDTRYYTWLGWRIGKLIASGHVVPLRVPDVIAPYGLDLRLLDGYLPSYVAGLW